LDKITPNSITRSWLEFARNYQIETQKQEQGDQNIIDSFFAETDQKKLTAKIINEAIKHITS